MLFISAELSKPKRLQGAYLSDHEIERVVDYLKQKAKPEYNSAVTESHGSLNAPANFLLIILARPMNCCPKPSHW